MIGNFQEFIKDMESGVYDYTKNGRCVGCGKCCSNLLALSEREIPEIRRYMKKYHVQEKRHILPTRELSIDMTCPFLIAEGGNQKCTIYPVRPRICVAFVCNQPPSKIRENKEHFWKTRKPCDMRETFFKKE